MKTKQYGYKLWQLFIIFKLCNKLVAIDIEFNSILSYTPLIFFANIPFICWTNLIFLQHPLLQVLQKHGINILHFLLLQNTNMGNFLIYNYSTVITHELFSSLHIKNRLFLFKTTVLIS